MALIAERAGARPVVPAPLAPPTAAVAALKGLRAAADGRLGLSELAPLLTAYGIPILTPRLATSPGEAASFAAQLGCPVALKVASPDISHKTDVGGVTLALTSPGDVAHAAALMLARVRARRPSAAIHGVLIQPMRPRGRNCSWAPCATRSSGRS
jgi:acetyltransferase